MNVAFVVVTHDLTLAERMASRLNLVEGSIESLLQA
jgi:predicted ABC-type transport system involved in lysophospholipase L1 biosynthesis ATPase subunit